MASMSENTQASPFAEHVQDTPTCPNLDDPALLQIALNIPEPPVLNSQSFLVVSQFLS